MCVLYRYLFFVLERVAQIGLALILAVTPVDQGRRDASSRSMWSGPARLMIGVGETYDFEYTAPPGRRNLWLEVRNTGGAWQVQGQVILK